MRERERERERVSESRTLSYLECVYILYIYIYIFIHILQYYHICSRISASQTISKRIFPFLKSAQSTVAGHGRKTTDQKLGQW